MDNIIAMDNDKFSMGSFTMLSNAALESDLITVAEKTVLAVLKSFCFGNSNVCFPGVNKIADRLKCSVRKIRYALRSLKEKHIIKVEAQYRENNSQTTNHYTIYDFQEIWQAESIEEIGQLVEEYEEYKRLEAIEALREKAVKSVKAEKAVPTTATLTDTVDSPPDIKKELDDYIDFPSKGNNISQAPKKKFNYSYNNTRAVKCQEGKEKFVEVYSMDYLKEHYNYDVILNFPKMDKDILDSVMSVIYETLNTSRSEVRVRGEYLPADIVKSKLLKLDYEDIAYVIDKYTEQTERIHNQRAYLLTLLYNAKEQHLLDVRNQVNYDMTHTDWSKLRKEWEQQQDSENLYDLFKHVTGYKEE